MKPKKNQMTPDEEINSYADFKTAHIINELTILYARGEAMAV